MLMQDVQEFNSNFKEPWKKNDGALRFLFR